jgi:hypothetical protein
MKCRRAAGMLFIIIIQDQLGVRAQADREGEQG